MANNPWAGVPASITKDWKTREKAEQEREIYDQNPNGYVYVENRPVTSDDETSAERITPDTTQRTPPEGQTTVYWKDGTTMNVPNGDLEYWKGQEWSPTPPVGTDTPGQGEGAYTEGVTDLDPAEKESIDNLMDGLKKQRDDGTITNEQFFILAEIVSGDYVSGANIPTEAELSQIIQDAATNAETDLSPYYETLTERELDDVRQGFADIRDAASRYEKSEAIDYKAKLQQTKQSLRSRGLTFSGISRGILGAEGALDARGVKGEMPTARRLGYEEQVAGYQAAGREIGTSAERRLGSEPFKTMNLGITTPLKLQQDGSRQIYSPTGTIKTGDIALDRLKNIEESTWNRVSRYRPFI